MIFIKIVSTFVRGLYAFRYSGEEFDELERLFYEWNDIEILHDFFEENKNDLRFFHVNMDEAIIETRKEVAGLRKKLMVLSSKVNTDLDSIFVNLDDSELKIVELAKQKSKRRWLRLYAFLIDTNTYVITGGAIKLTHKMNERPHTNEELIKLDICRNYLKEQGVFDVDSFNELNI